MSLNLFNYKLLTDYILTLTLFLIAVNPFFVDNKLFKLFFFILLFAVFLYRSKKLDLEVFIVIFVAFIIMLFQGLKFSFSGYTFLTFSVFSILTPYLFLKVVGLDFLKKASQLIFIFALISLPIYVLQISVPYFASAIESIELLINPFSSLPERKSLVIYTISTHEIDGVGNGILRNFGMYHEPGAFATFLTFALGTNLLLKQKLSSKKNIILIVSMVTTFSTAGYIALTILLIAYFVKTYSRKSSVLIMLSIVAIPVILKIYSLPFIEAKIEEKVETEINQSLSTPTSGRILGARKALYVLEKYPIWGRGLISASRESDISSPEYAGYGFMVFFSQLGIPFSLIFLVYFIIGITFNKLLIKDYSFFLLLYLIANMINLFSQKFIGDAFFIVFFFIGLLPYYRKLSYKYI